MQVLCVDDNEIALELLCNSLEQFGYKVTPANDGQEALNLIRTGIFPMVISDWEMPNLNGLQLCREIRKMPSGGYVYIILVTARKAKEDVVAGLDAGADDFITKPFDPMELCVRVRAGVRILSLDTRDVTIFSLAKLTESRDAETGAHLERVREYSRLLAQDLLDRGRFSHVLDAHYVDMIYQTSPLHDIGKVGIPDHILRKPGRLTDDEFDIIKRHTIIGAKTLNAAAQERPDAAYLHIASDIARSHHERYDGAGYPDGLVADAIPLCARIVAVADVYDALTSERVYKEKLSHAAACKIMLSEAEKHFDPEVIEAFRNMEQQFVAVNRRYGGASVDDATAQQLACLTAEG